MNPPVPGQYENPQEKFSVGPALSRACVNLVAGAGETGWQGHFLFSSYKCVVLFQHEAKSDANVTADRSLHYQNLKDTALALEKLLSDSPLAVNPLLQTTLANNGGNQYTGSRRRSLAGANVAGSREDHHDTALRLAHDEAGKFTNIQGELLREVKM